MDKHSNSTDYICSITLSEIKDIIKTGESRVLYNSDESRFTIFSEAMAKEVLSKYGNDLLWMGEKVTKLRNLDKNIFKGIKHLKSFGGIYDTTEKSHQVSLWEI